MAPLPPLPLLPLRTLPPPLPLRTLPPLPTLLTLLTLLTRCPPALRCSMKHLRCARAAPTAAGVGLVHRLPRGPVPFARRATAKQTATATPQPVTEEHVHGHEHARHAHEGVAVAVHPRLGLGERSVVGAPAVELLGALVPERGGAESWLGGEGVGVWSRSGCSGSAVVVVVLW